MKRLLATIVIVLSVINMTICQDWFNKGNDIVFVQGDNSVSINSAEIRFNGGYGAFSDEHNYVNMKYKYIDSSGSEEIEKIEGLSLYDISEDGTSAKYTNPNIHEKIMSWLKSEGQTIEFSNERFYVTLRGNMPFIGEKK